MTQISDTAESPGDREFSELLEKIERDRGFAAASYKERCLRRRVGVRMRVRGVHRYRDYARVLDDDAVEYDRLIEALTIHVTKLFRNREVFEEIARSVVPPLLDSRRRPLRAWSAGCASGHEPYSLAVLFHHHAAASGQLARLADVTVIGTDVDAASLRAAERGWFEERDFAETPAELRRRYFADRPPHTIDAEVRALVQFRHGDLLRDPPPAPSVDLVICRNVLIYLDRASQERVFARFTSALAPGGFLVLGKVETLLGPFRREFVAVSARDRIYRRA